MLIYQDAGLKLQVRLDGQTVWLTQAQLGELYQTSKQNIRLHIQNILDENELRREAMVKEYLTTAADGARGTADRRTCLSCLTNQPTTARLGGGTAGRMRRPAQPRTRTHRS